MKRYNAKSSMEARQATKNKYRIFNPDYVIFAAENWAVESNIQLLNHIVERSSNAAFKAQAKRLLAHFEALGIPENLKLNLWAKAQQEPLKQKPPSTPQLSLRTTKSGKDGER